jgi:hypothetical protein
VLINDNEYFQVLERVKEQILRAHYRTVLGVQPKIHEEIRRDFSGKANCVSITCTIWNGITYKQ